MDRVTVVIDTTGLSLGKHLALPFFIETIDGEVEYEYTTYPTLVEVVETTVLVCFGAWFTPTKGQSKTILSFVNSILLEEAVLETIKSKL